MRSPLHVLVINSVLTWGRYAVNFLRMTFMLTCFFSTSGYIGFGLNLKLTCNLHEVYISGQPWPTAISMQNLINIYGVAQQ